MSENRSRSTIAGLAMAFFTAVTPTFSQAQSIDVNTPTGAMASLFPATIAEARNDPTKATNASVAANRKITSLLPSRIPFQFTYEGKSVTTHLNCNNAILSAGSGGLTASANVLFLEGVHSTVMGISPKDPSKEAAASQAAAQSSWFPYDDNDVIDVFTRHVFNIEGYPIDPSGHQLPGAVITNAEATCQKALEPINEAIRANSELAKKQLCEILDTQYPEYSAIARCP